MGGFAEYDAYDGLGLAELIRRGEVTPQELCDEAMSRMERLNPKLNAIVYPMYDVAREAMQAGLPEGPFHGVPFLLKDLLAEYAGVPMTSGSRAFQRYIPHEDSELVRRFKRAGLLTLGKTNTPELGLLPYTEPDLHGPCRNPWNPDHTPGGSSGGSGAAVAAGMVPVASGGDGGGSIRIPASCCGLFGLKPTRGRTPTGPRAGKLWQGAAVEHVLTRSVRDSAAMLDATHGPDPGPPYGIAPPEGAYLDEVGRAPGRLRIALDTSSPIGTDVHPECVEAVRRTARLLTDMGHEVAEARPPIDGRAVAISFVVMLCAEFAADVAAIREMYGAGAVKTGLEPATRVLGLLGQALSAADYAAALRTWDTAARAMGAFFQSYDLYLTPTLARPPMRIGELAPKPAEQLLMGVFNALGAGGLLKAAGLVEKLAIQTLAAAPFTQLANVTGLPAMSVPLHWTPDGLPVGVHFTAPFGEEGRLFRLAGRLEEAAPWFDRRPPVR